VPDTIYALEDPNGYMIYVGATIDPRRREVDQRRCWPGTTFHVLEEDPPDGLQAAERRWIADGRSWGWPLENRTAGGEPGWVGQHHTDEARAKIGAAKKGVPKSDSHRAALSIALSGAQPTDEHRAALALAWTDERRAAFSALADGCPT
jgi:hypothetical protein